MVKAVNIGLAIGTGCVVIVAVVVASVTIGLFAPQAAVAIPFVSMALAGAAVGYIKNRISVAKSADLQANTCQKIRSIQQRIPMSIPDFLSHLKKLNVRPFEIKDPAIKKNITSLRPIVAHYEYWHDLSLELQMQSEQLQKQQRDHSENFPDEIEEIYKIRMSSLASAETALICKTKAAFYLGLLKNPTFSKEIKDTLIFNDTLEGSNLQQDTLILGRRSLYERFNDLRERNIIKINQTGQKSTFLTQAQLKDLSEADLSKMIFA
jgi:hypothetical protein